MLRARLPPHPALSLSTDEGMGASTNVTANVTANERQEWFLQQIARGINVRPAMMSAQFGITERTAKRDIAALQDAELIVFVGSTKTGRYLLLTPQREPQ